MFPAFVADFTPLSAGAQTAAVSVLGVVLIIFSIWAIMRRRPPLDSELAKLHGAIASLQKAVDKLNGDVEDHAAHATEITSLKEKVEKLEHHREEDQRSAREYTRKSTHEIFEKLDGIAQAFTQRVERVSEIFAEKSDQITSSFSNNVQQLERSIGKLEGACEQLGKRLDNLES